MAKNPRVNEGKDIKYGERVIAFRKKYDLPYTINPITNELIQLYPSSDGEPFAGIVGAIQGNSYMIFFDDGHVQNIKRHDIATIMANDDTKHGINNSLANIFLNFLLKI